MKEYGRAKKGVALAVLLVGLIAATSLYATGSIQQLVPESVVYARGGKGNDAGNEEPQKPKALAVEHMETPAAVRAVYMSQCAASTQSFRDSLFSLAAETEINAIVVDLKDYTGTISFPSETAIPEGSGCTVPDFRELVKEMHERGIYVIGRLTVFQDPLYTRTHPELAVKRASDPSSVWKDHKGLAFVDVGAEPFWDYIVALSKEAHALGVDEVNFDYIRYPSDGNMSDVHYDHSTGEKPEQLEKFFQYLANALAEPDSNGHRLVMSADLFGMTTTNYDDLSIGQVLERALPYFDYIAPMVYPSHYPPQFNGWANPNDHVYGVVNYSMEHAVARAVSTTTPIASMAYERIGTSTPAVYRKPSYEPTVLRPWLQDFDYGGDYGPTEVRNQIQATYDAGLNSWMLWAPSNRYTRGALNAE